MDAQSDEDLPEPLLGRADYLYYAVVLTSLSIGSLWFGRSAVMLVFGAPLAALFIAIDVARRRRRARRLEDRATLARVRAERERRDESR